MLNRFASFAICVLALTASVFAEQSESKPLSNADVIALYKGGLDAPTIVNAIQSQDTNFDISATGLLQLKKSAVPPKVLDAVIAAVGKRKAMVESASALPATPTSQPEIKPKEEPIAAKPGQPFVVLSLDGKRLLVPVTQSQLVQTKAKPTNLASLATEGSFTQAMGGVTQSVAAAGSMKGSSKIVNTAMMANPLFGGAMLAGSLLSHRRQQSMTEVWALPGSRSETQIHNAQPSFEVHCDNIPGINPDDYKPVLLKLETTPNNFRLVGATEVKQDAVQSPASEYPMYSTFVEESGPSQFTKLASGSYQLQASSALPPGEYAVVLRPVSKDKKFTGNSILQNTGDGLVFNSVWSFSVVQ
jgi:hypothetical protein